MPADPMIDVLGRTVTALDGVNVTLESLKTMIEGAKTGDPTKVGGGDTDFSSLKTSLEKVIEGFAKASSEQEAFVKKVVRSLKSVNVDKAEKNTDKKRTKREKKYQENLKKITRKAFGSDIELNQKKLALAVKNEAKIQNINESEIYGKLETSEEFFKKIKESAEALSEFDIKTAIAQGRLEDIGFAISRVADSEKEAEKASEEWERALYNATSQLSTIGSYLSSFEKGIGLDTLKTLFDDLYETEVKFTQEMRQIAFETAGATSESFNLQRAYENIGATVVATGVDRTKFQESYKKALRSGVKDLKQAVNLTTTQLNTEKQLGMEAGSLQETFQSFVQSGRMSSNQIADMGRGMRDVARNTGITGESLKGVVDSSKEFIDQMRKASTLSATSAKNIIELGANAKKLGVEEEMNSLRKGLSSTNGLLVDAAGQTQTLIFMAASKIGKVQEAINGTLMDSKEGIKEFAGGLRGVLAQFGVESLEAIDQLGPEAKKVLNLQLKASVGMELGAFRSIIESYEESGKSLGDRLGDINKKMEKNITLEEKATLMEQQRQMKASKQLEILTALDESSKGAQNMNEALAKFGERRKDFEKDLKDMGTTWTDETQVARESLEGALKSINQGLVKAGKKELKIDSKSIEEAVKDPSKFRELTAQIVKGEQELATAQKAQLDPISQTNQTLSQINDGIRGLTQSIISTVMSSIVGQLLVVAAVLAGIGYGITQMIGSLVQMREAFYKIAGFDTYYSKGNGFLENIDILLGQIKEQKSLSAAAAPDATLANPNTAIKPPETANTTTSTTTIPEPAKTPNPKDVPSSTTTADPHHTKSATEDHKPTVPPELAAPKTPAPVGSDKGGGGGGGGFDSSKMLGGGADMAKMAGTILAVSVGVVALGSAIVFLADKVMSSFDLDLNKVMEVAQVVGALALAGGSIAAAGIAAFMVMTSPEAKAFSDDAMSKMPQFLKMAAVILVVGPAIVALGAAVVAITSLVLKKINVDVSKIGEVSGVVVALGAAAAGVAVGVDEMTRMIDKNKTTIDNIIKELPTYLYYMIVGGAALFALATGIVILGVALVKMSQLILGMAGIDSQTAGKIALDIASLFGAVGVIAIAVIGASAGLIGLGMLAQWAVNPIAAGTPLVLMAIGAGALLALSLVIPFLAAAVVKFASSANEWVGGNDAIIAAENVGKLLLAAGAIALGVLGATAGLIGLGMLATGSGGIGFLAMIGFMIAGTAALLALSIVIPRLAAAVINLAASVMSKMGMDPNYAKEVADAFGGIMMAAGKIALGVLLSVAALTALGALAITTPWLVGALALGALALYLLIDPVGRLASAVIEIAAATLGQMVDPKEAEETGKALAGILGSVGTIAWEVSKISAILSGFAFLNAFNLVAGIMSMGVQALEGMLEPVKGYVSAILDFSKNILEKVDPKESEKIGKEVADIFNMVGSVTKIISSDGAGILDVPVYGDFWNWLGGSKVSTRMNTGANALAALTVPMITYIDSIIEFVSDVTSKVGDSKGWSSKAKEVAGVLSSAGEITKYILEAKDNLTKLNWDTRGKNMDRVKNAMRNGALALDDLSLPVGTYLQTITKIGNSIKTSINMSPERAADMAKGIASILESAGSVTKEIMKSRDSLMSIEDSQEYWLWGRTVAERMRQGSAALVTMSFPLVTYLLTVKSIVERMKSSIGMSPAQAIDMAEGFKSILNSVNGVAEVINEASNKMLKVAASARVQGGSQKFSKNMEVAINALQTIRQSLSDYISTSMKFAEELSEKYPLSKTKQALDNVEGITKIVVSIAKILETMIEKIVPLTEKKIFKMGKTQFQGLEDSRQQLATFFPLFTSLIKTIVEEAADAVKDMSGVLKAIDNIDAMVQVVSKIDVAFKKVQEISEVFKFKYDKSLSTGGAIIQGRTAEIDAIKTAITSMTGENGFLKLLFNLFDKILEQTAKLPKKNEITDAAIKMDFMTMMLRSFATSMKSFDEVSRILVTQKGVKGKDLEAQKTSISEKITSIIEFIKDDVIKTLNSMPEPTKLRQAAMNINDLSNILNGTLGLVKGLNGIMEETAGKKSFWVDSDEEFEKNKVQFKKRLAAVSSLIMDGIVGPVMSSYRKDAVNLTFAAGVISDLSNVVNRVPSMLNNLREAMLALFEQSDAQGVAGKAGSKLDKLIEDYAPQLGPKFKKLSELIRDGIVNPLATVFKDVDFKSALSNAQNVKEIVILTPTIIKELYSAFSYMSENIKNSKDIKFPIDNIIQRAGAFKENYQKIIKIIKEDILDVFQNEKTVITAAQAHEAQAIVNSITHFLESLPKMFEVLNAFVKLGTSINPDGNLYHTLPTILRNLDDAFFDTQLKGGGGGTPAYEVKTNRIEKISKFISEVLLPSFKGLPSESETNSAIVKIQSTIDFFEKIKELFVDKMIPLIVSSGAKNVSPLEVLGLEAAKYKTWFEAINDLIRTAILGFVDKLPVQGDVDGVKNKIAPTIQLLNEINPLLKELSNLIVSSDPAKLFANSPVAMIGQNKGEYIDWFSAVSEFIHKGLVDPLNINLPTEKIADDLNNRIKGMMSVMNGYTNFLGTLTNMMKVFKGENSQFMASGIQMKTTTPEEIAKNAQTFRDNFKEIASFLYNAFEYTLSSSSGEGLKYFPEESRAKDVTDRIANMSKIVKDYGLMMQELISTISLMSNLKTNGFDETKFTADFNAVSRFLWSAFEVTIGGNDKVGGYFPSGDRAKNVIERIANMSKIVKDYSSMMKDLSAAITNLSAIDIKDLDASKFNEKLNSLLSSLKVGGLDLQKSSPIAEIETIIKVYEGVYTSLSKLEKIMNDIANKMKSISGINFDMQKIKGMGLGMGENAGSLGLSNISAVVENGMEPQTATVMANTAPVNQISDVENKIMANKAGASMPTAKVTSDELSDIASENEEQNAKLQTLIGLFKDVVDLLKPKPLPTVANSNTPFGVNAYSPKLPPPRFARAITGLPQSMPDTAVVNIGSNAIM